MKRVGIGLDEKSKSYAYWIEFYKVIDEKTKECVIVGYEINMQGVPVQPISSISCKEDCSEAKFKVKNSSKGEDIIELNKNDKGKYDGKINNEKKITETLSQNMKSILPGEKIGQLCFLIDALGYSMLKVHNNEVVPALNQQINPNISTTMNYANKSLKLIIDFDPHGYHFISANQINYNQASLYHYSLYDEEGLRLGELGFYHTSNQLEGTLWLEKTNRVYPVKGTWNIYEDFFSASANTEEGSYVFEKNDFDGLVKTYWHAPGYHGFHILQSNTIYLPHIALNRKDMESNDNSLYPILSWNQNSTQLSDYEKSLLSGTRIIRTENISQTQKIIDLPYNSGSFTDFDVNPFVSYQYIISSSIKYNLDCGFPELSYPLYSYPEYYDWSTDSIAQNQNIDSTAIINLWNKLNLTSNEAKILHSKSKFPWWIPGIIGAGTGLYFIFDHKDIVETPPQAIDDEVQLQCGETLTFDPLANDLGEFLSVQSVTGTGSASVSIQNNKLVFSNLFNSQTTLTYTIKDKNGATSSAIISVSVILPNLNIQDISISAQSGDKLNGNIFSASSCLGCKVISLNSATSALITWAKDGSYEINVPVKDEFTTYTFEFFIQDQCAQNGRILLTISAKGTDCNITITSEIFSPHCGSHDGSILLTGFDVLTYNYQWNNGMTDYNISNLPAGQYSVTLTHMTKNCHAYYSVTLMEKFQKIITNVAVEPGNCYKSGKFIVNVNRLSSNTLTLLVTGSSGSFQFSSSNENIDIVNLIQNTGYPEPITGPYKVVIFDASLPSICRDSIETEIPIENLLIQANDDKYEIKSGELYTGNVLTNDLGVGLNVVSYSNNENGTLTIDKDGSFTFTTKPNITGQIKYLYEVTDTCAQISTASLVFTVSSEECNYQATFMVTPAFCGASNGEVVATIFPNEGNLQFTWSNGTEGLKLINVSTGDYTLTLYNPTLSCSQSFEIFVPEEQLLYVTNAQITQGTCQNPPEILLNLQAPISGILNIVVNGLNSQSAFQIIEGDVFISEYIDLYPGNWTITINDQGAGPGCAQTYTYELEPFSSLSISLVQIIPPSTPSSNNGVVILEISEGAAPITIFANSLLFPNRFPGLNTLKGFSVGLYNIVAIDNVGCKSNTLTIEFQTLLNSEKPQLSYSPATWIPVKIPGSAEKGNDVSNFKNTSATFLNLSIIENNIALSGGLGTVSTYRLINGNQELRQGSFVSFFLGKSISLGESNINLGIRDTYVSSGINQHYNYMSLQFDWMMHFTKNIQFQCGASYLLLINFYMYTMAW
ncbi:MAG: cadherin-like domain-containing protein [Saprospiraceae bacterium]|nr:cadherin-like domain-containing protein [Saprospiraceae bacterium]